ncbi:MFS transporter [Leptolyngbya sp. NK1-12]|uniref:MFS transporter n=1 Tax=Leptolyngbya sp. NK1-12 TaxID=2547451 RepID=A0AA96WAR4_9CYAN|nr:MFS transporter [Leptolyngbya sp. NK1-12]MBF2047874.1 MFS transporter [Elainella sp. C42_A2020_010]WNZ21430.1 MFS transporter [Leptolyngbya sp. NK1-12]
MSESSAPRPVVPPPLNFSTKLAYGAGDLGPAITANILAFFLLFFFTNVAGMNAALAGSVLMIGKIWDAVNDPLVGVLSDRTRSARWGRRYPWMLYGAIPFGVTFFLQWVVPRFSQNEAANQWGLFAYYVLISVLFNIFYTMVNLPYTALTPELTQDYNERTSLNSFRFAFSIGGSILSLILALVIFRIVPDAGQQYLWLGGICAVISTLPLYWCVFGTYRRTMAMVQLHGSQNEQNIPFFTQLKIAFSNRPFLFVIGIYLCSWLAVQITATILPYFVVNCLGLSSETFTLIALAVQGTALLMLFVWSAISARVGKKAVYFMGMVLWIIAQAGLFFLQPNQSGLVYPLAIMAGIGVSTAYLIPWSMIPDVIELDELNTGQRREGIFYGFMVLLQKLGLALGLFIVGQALDQAGFIESVAGQPTPVQPESALLAIRLAIGPVPTVALIIGLFLAYFYPITREVHAEILLKLRERQERQ